MKPEHDDAQGRRVRLEAEAAGLRDDERLAAFEPTGWEITLDLVRRIARAQNVDDQPDWAAWYRSKTGADPSYSVLLEQLASSPDERRSILNRYIEPDQNDRNEGKKVPTPAHHAIARLVGGGHVRVILTTNFDRLLENALREEGIEPTVVSSPDAMLGAQPLIHSSCYILKLHGDYKDYRILNTEQELSNYPSAYNQVLDRIFDEHGLIICGWSGEWDPALRAAFLRASNRRYSVYWVARGELSSRAQQLVSHRAAKVISAPDADTFFSKLQQSVETLEQSRRENPLSVDLLVNSAKRFLALPQFRIQLDQIFADEAHKVLQTISAPEFKTQQPWDQLSFRTRVSSYEAITEALACMMGVLGRWGQDSEFALAVDIIRALYSWGSVPQNGLVVYNQLRIYPAVLLFTAYGIGLTKAERWRLLHNLFCVPFDTGEKEPKPALEALFLGGELGGRDLWNELEWPDREHTRRYTPFSDRLHQLFAEWSSRFFGLMSGFDLVFERFELLGSIAFLEGSEGTSLEQVLSLNPTNFIWVPVGRVAWHGSNREILQREFMSEAKKAALLSAGFGKNDASMSELSLKNFKRMSDRMRW